jgi:hypothetical protein
MEGVLQALNCAEDVINWLGDKEIYYSKAINQFTDLEVYGQRNK